MNTHQTHQTADTTVRVQQTRNTFGSPRDLISMLFRRKVIFLAVFGLILTASVISLRGQQVVYVATAKVLVIRGRSAENISGVVRLQWWEEMKTEVEVACSQPVAERAAAMMARQTAERAREQGIDLATVGSEPISSEALLGGLSVEPIDETDVIRLSYRSLDRQQAIDGVNAITESYLDYSRLVQRDPQAVETLTGKLDEEEAETDRLSAEIAAYKHEHHITDVSSEMIELTRQRKAVENHLIEVRATRHATALEVETLERARRENPDLLLASEEMKRDPQIASYVRRLTELDHKLNSLLATYTPDNPQVRAVERDRKSCIADIEEQIDHFIAAKRTTVETLRAEESAYETELARVGERIASLPAHEAHLERLQQQLRMARGNLETIQEYSSRLQYQEDVGSEVSKLRLLYGASSAKRLGGGARKQLFLVASLVLALGFAFVAAFMVDTLDHSIKFPSDIEEALGVPVLASIREVRGSWSPAPPRRRSA